MSRHKEHENAVTIDGTSAVSGVSELTSAGVVAVAELALAHVKEHLLDTLDEGGQFKLSVDHTSFSITADPLSPAGLELYDELRAVLADPANVYYHGAN